VEASLLAKNVWTMRAIGCPALSLTTIASTLSADRGLIIVRGTRSQAHDLGVIAVVAQGRNAERQNSLSRWAEHITPQGFKYLRQTAL